MDEGVTKIGDALPETFEEIRDGFMEVVWKQREDLKGVALVNALAALAKLAEANRERDEAKAQPEPTVADVIGGIENMPVVGRLRVMAGALAGLDREFDAVRGFAAQFGVSEPQLRAAVEAASALPSASFEWRDVVETQIQAALDAGAKGGLA